MLSLLCIVARGMFVSPVLIPLLLVLQKFLSGRHGMQTKKHSVLRSFTERFKNLLG
jgi:hypothetical protein